MTDDSNPEAQWASEDNEFTAFLHDATTPKTDLAQAYVAATSTEQLLTLAVEPLCLSAADIFFTVNSPGPLNIVTDLQKRLMPKRYWAECARTNALFAECLLCVLEKFDEFVGAPGWKSRRTNLTIWPLGLPTIGQAQSGTHKVVRRMHFGTKSSKLLRHVAGIHRKVPIACAAS